MANYEYHAKKCSIPAEPIRRVIEAWMKEWEAEHELMPGIYQSREEIRLSGLQAAANAIWGETNGKTTPFKTLWRMMQRGEGYKVDSRGRRERIQRESIDFDLADKILCRLEMVHLWQEDPELREIYEAMDLFALDLRRPTCKRAGIQTAKKAQKMVDKMGWFKARRHLGIHYPKMQEIVARLG